MCKIAIQSEQFIQLFGEEKGLEKIRECGFDGVDFCLTHALETGILNADEEGIKSYFTRVKQTAQNLGLSIVNAYLPMPLEDINARINAVKAASYLGAEYLTLCPIVLEKAENNYKKNKALNVEYYTALSKTMQDYKVKIAIENRSLKSADVWRFFAGKPSAVSSAEKLLDLLESLGDNFYVSLDFGHAYLAEEDIPETIALLADKLALVRLWDTDVAEARHIAPTFGYIQWQDALDALRRSRYKGALLMDVDILRSGEKVFLPFAEYLSSLGKSFAKSL